MGEVTICERCGSRVMSTRLDAIRALVARASPGRLMRMWITAHDGETRVPTIQIEEGPVHDRRYRPASDVDWSLALRARDDLTFLLGQLTQTQAREAVLVEALRELAGACIGLDNDAIGRALREAGKAMDDTSPPATALLAVVDGMRAAVCASPYIRLPGGRDQTGRTQPDTWVCHYCGAERGRQDHDRGCFWQVAQGRFGPLLARLDGTVREAAP